MSTLSATISEEYTQRYEALFRATNAIGTCCDCDSTADVLIQALREVITFDYLQLVTFETDTRTVGWHLLYSNGARQSLALADVIVEGAPIEWVHDSQQPLVTANWNEETRFAKHSESLNELGIVSTCILPLARGQRRLGVLSIGRSRPDAYPEDEVRFLSLVADQIALAIDAAVNFYLSHPRSNQSGRFEPEFSGTAADDLCECSPGHAVRRRSDHAARARRRAFTSACSRLPRSQRIFQGRDFDSN